MLKQTLCLNIDKNNKKKMEMNNMIYERIKMKMNSIEIAMQARKKILPSIQIPHKFPSIILRDDNSNVIHLHRFTTDDQVMS